jgi:hypothetical protein
MNIRRFRLKIGIAVLGCVISIGSTIVASIVRWRAEESATADRNALASSSAELLRRDRMFDMGHSYEGMWQQTRLQLLTFAGVWRSVFPPAVESIENQLADALCWGYASVHGKLPSGEVYADFSSWAHIVAAEEARVARLAGSHDKDELPLDRDVVGNAVTHVTAQLSNDVAEYWSNRATFLTAQEGLRTRIRSSEAKLRRIDSLVLALQILGLMVVLMKDLVPSDEDGSRSLAFPAIG